MENIKEKRKIYALISSEQFRNIAIFIAIFLFYVFYFRLICNSGLSADDMWNSNIQAAPYLNGPSAWEVMWNQMITWLKLGRVFPFSNYAAVLFTFISSVPLYKACIVGTIVINALICGECVKAVSKSESVRIVFLLLFPLFLQLTPEFDSGLYCYHMLIQMVVLWCFLSLWCILRYLECHKKRYAAGSAVFLFLALGTYEVAFVFLFALLWVVWAIQKNWKSVITICLPDLIVFLCMGLMNLGARLFLQEGAYQGISVSFSMKAVLITFLKQCSTCFPVGRYICSGLKYCDPYTDVYPYSLSGILSWVRIGDILAVLLFLGIFITVGTLTVKAGTWSRKKSNTGQEGTKAVLRNPSGLKPEYTLIGLGLIVFLFPGMLIAVSAKYQQILGWCSGHLPAYMQSVGLAIAVTGIYALIMKGNWKQLAKQVLSWGCVCAAVIIILLNLVSGRAGVEYMNRFRKYPQENITAAAKAGFFDDIAEDGTKILFGTTAYIYDQSCTGEFYSKLTDSHIYAITRNELVNQCVENYGILDVYEIRDWQEQEYYGVFNMAEQDSGALIMGKCVQLELNEAGTDFQHVWIQDPKVFIRGETAAAIPEDWEVLLQDKEYGIYRLEGVYDVMQETEYYKNEAGTGVLYRE